MAAASQIGNPGVGMAELEQLFRENHAMVFRAAYRVTGNLTDAEDVLQTVFMRLVQREPGSEPLENTGSYLYRAAVNAALDVVRARRGAQRVAMEEVVGELAGSDSESPDEIHRWRELRQWLDGALNRLNRRSAEMFVLRSFEGLDNQEIAEMLGTTPGTVAVTLHRTREALQEELKAYLGGSR